MFLKCFSCFVISNRPIKYVFNVFFFLNSHIDVSTTMKLTTNRHEASRDLSATTAELLVIPGCSKRSVESLSS